MSWSNCHLCNVESQPSNIWDQGCFLISPRYSSDPDLKELYPCYLSNIWENMFWLGNIWTDWRCGSCLCWRLVYRTCVFVFSLADGVGWVGVGWGGLITINGTSTHTWCYATDHVSCTCTHTWCYATDLVSCTCTHTWCYATDLVSCTCTHTWCYANRPRLLHLHTIPDATLQMGWGGVGWGGLITFSGTSTHTWCYATCLFSCTCTHTWCYATDLVSCTCTHTWCYATDLVSCTCTHTWCYATDLVSCTCTHAWCYATDLVSCTCTHTWCYATDGLGWGGVGWANNVQWH